MIENNIFWCSRLKLKSIMHQSSKIFSFLCFNIGVGRLRIWGGGGGHGLEYWGGAKV